MAILVTVAEATTLIVDRPEALAVEATVADPSVGFIAVATAAAVDVTPVEAVVLIVA